MPIIKSAKKKLRQDVKRTKQNEVIRKLLKDAIKKATKKPTAKAVSEAQKIADKAAKTHVIHKNKAARIKARVAKVLASHPASKSS